MDNFQAHKKARVGIIKPKNNWTDLRLRELWYYRDLIILFVKRDFISVYKQTILGPLWFIIQPLLTTITFTIVFGNIAKLSTDGLPQPLFYMAGVVVWQYFATCITKTSSTFITNAGIFGKVYFPRLSIPIATVINGMITFAIQLLIFIIILLYYYIKGGIAIHINAFVLLTPVLLIIMAALGLGFGIIVSSLTTKYRDLTFLINFAVQLLMYATPVIYPLSSLPPKIKNIIIFNPMTSVVETFRFAFTGTGAFSFNQFIYSIISTFIILMIGIFIFNKVEKNFMDTI
jgi:lipopolysaccharide transport system permease protein